MTEETRTRPIYFDYHATTPVDPRVRDAMWPYFGERFGNAASKSHVYGWEADDAVGLARKRVADLIGCRDGELVFTSGATESNNLAIKGAVEARGGAAGAHVIVACTEHKSVLDSAKHLVRAGATMTVLEVDARGQVDPQAVADAICDETVLVSVMHTNNEVGTVQPLAEISQVTRERGVLLHCDAAQATAWATIDVEQLGVDLLSLTAHKMYGSKGVGALYVRRREPRVALIAQMDGGGHERGNRSGTLAVPLIVGFGEAAQIAVERRGVDEAHARTLRDSLRERLEAGLDGVLLNGPDPRAGERRHPGNLNVSLEHVEAEGLMIALKDLAAVSTGSACSSASLQPSYVLRACGISVQRAHHSIRFGVGRFSTEAEVAAVADAVIAAARKIRAASPERRLAAKGVEVDW